MSVCLIVNYIIFIAIIVVANHSCVTVGSFVLVSFLLVMVMKIFTSDTMDFETCKIQNSHFFLPNCTLYLVLKG